jgi:hypothetical protein
MRALEHTQKIAQFCARSGLPGEQRKRVTRMRGSAGYRRFMSAREITEYWELAALLELPDTRRLMRKAEIAPARDELENQPKLTDAALAEWEALLRFDGLLH